MSMTKERVDLYLELLSEIEDETNKMVPEIHKIFNMHGKYFPRDALFTCIEDGELIFHDLYRGEDYLVAIPASYLYNNNWKEDLVVKIEEEKRKQQEKSKREQAAIIEREKAALKALMKKYPDIAWKETSCNT